MPSGRHACTCPRDDTAHDVLEGHCLVGCPSRRASWSRRERLRGWLSDRIKIGAITPYRGEGEASQRPMTRGEAYAALTGTDTPAEFIDGSSAGGSSRYQAFQLKVIDDSYGYHLRSEPPSWHHLLSRVITLCAECAVITKRFLLWTAPFVGTAYVILEFCRWLSSG